MAAGLPGRLIVFFSDFGPLQNPLFTLGWDMLAVAVFSLAIFYWAMAVALPTDRIEEMISDVELNDDPAAVTPSVADEPLSRGA